MKNVQFRFPNGVLFVSDATGGSAPYPKWGTPDRTVVVSTVDLRKIASTQVTGDATRVRIWVNDSTVPDRVTIGVG
jgi:hypothetical protein